MPNFQISLLGRFSACVESKPLRIQASSARLLAYLALSVDKVVSRTRIAGALWPDLEEGRARADLSTVLWRLQAALSAHGCHDAILHARSNSIGLSGSACEVDAEIFKHNSMAPGAAVSLDGLARAVRCVDLYQGDLLEDWDVEWCVLEREHFRRRYLFTLKGLAEGFERLQRYDLALRFAEKAADADPLNESIQRVLMRILHFAGDRVSAIAHFRRFASLVRTELAVEPSSETLALVGQISSRTAEPSTESDGVEVVVPDKVPLVGRHAERQRVALFLEAALTGDGGGMLVLGEVGIGKSRLAEWAMEEWAAKGGTAVLGRCVEFNAPVPYQPILDSLGSVVEIDDLLGTDGRRASDLRVAAVPQVGSAETPEGNSADQTHPLRQLRLFGQLRSRLTEFARRRAMLIVVEDLQWADAGTVDVISFMLGSLSGTRVAILLTSRRAGVKPVSLATVERLSRRCKSTIQLGPLDSLGTNDLVRSLTSGYEIPAKFATWVEAETEGNPLFIVETLRLHQQRRSIVRKNTMKRRVTLEDAPHDQSFDIPEGVRGAVERRLALVTPMSLRVATIASVLGRSFDEELLALIAGISPNRLSRAIRELIRSDVLRREAAGYRFMHDKIRAVCYESLPLHLRNLFHARAASVLAQVSDLPAHRLAWHQSSATQWHLAAISWERAGDQARHTCAYDDALRAYGYAVYCTRRDDTKNADAKSVAEVALLLKSEDIHSIAGMPDERRVILERIGDLSNRMPATTFRAAWFARRARLEEHVGNFALASRLARKAWSVANSIPHPASEIEGLRVLAWILSRSGRYSRSHLVSRLVLKKLANNPSPEAVTVLWQAAIACIWLGHRSAALSYLQRAKGIIAELGLPRDDPSVLTTQAVLDKWGGDLQSSRTGHLKALKLADEIGDLVTVAKATCSLATLDSLEGRLAGALRGLRRAIKTSRSTSCTRVEVSCLNEVANGVGRLLGNYSWAWSASNRALNLLGSRESRSAHAMCRDTQAQLLIDEGRPHEAKAVVDAVIRSLEPEQGPSGLHADLLIRRGVVNLCLAAIPGAVSDLETARDICMKAGDRLQLVDTLTYLALAYARNGEADRALGTSEEAIRLLTEIHCANLQPQRIFWHHFLILEQFDREPRVEYLRRAVELIEERGATLSRAQRRRFRQDVALNREILEAWERRQGNTEPHQTAPREVVAAPESIAAAPAATVGALSAVPGS